MADMISLLKRNIMDLPTNLSLSYLWCGGFMLSFFLVLQILSGVVLSFSYVGDVNQSFLCVVEMSKSLYGSLIRYAHVWGVSFIFLLLFLHIGRSFYYAGYNKQAVWNVGFILYFLMMIEAFLGYVLPWHQMSYWAATVLTSILQVIPILGDSLYSFVVGGFSVTGVTLVRLFSAHVCLGFVIIGLSVVHLFYLHSSGSGSPLFMCRSYGDFVLFKPYFVYKDGLAISWGVSLFLGIMLVSPDLVLDAEGFIEADPLVTPVSIKPEWYFLAYYAMLRSVSSKLGGLFLVLLFLFFVWLPVKGVSANYSLERQWLFWCLSVLFFCLSVFGACHPESPYVVTSFNLAVLGVMSAAVYKLEGVDVSLGDWLRAGVVFFRELWMLHVFKSFK